MESNSFFTGLGICSFAHRSFAHLLRSLRSNERLWAIRSDHSGQMSNCERIDQVTHDKRETVSDSLRLLRLINEQIARFLSESLICSFAYKKPVICSFFSANRSLFSKKWAIRSENRSANSQPCSEIVLLLRILSPPPLPRPTPQLNNFKRGLQSYCSSIFAQKCTNTKICSCPQPRHTVSLCTVL